MTLSELFTKIFKPLRHPSRRRLTTRVRLANLRAHRRERESASDGPFRTLHFAGETAEVFLFQIAEPRRSIKYLFGDVDQSPRHRSASGEDHTARDLSFLPHNFLRDVVKHLDGTRLHDVAKELF